MLPGIVLLLGVLEQCCYTDSHSDTGVLSQYTDSHSDTEVLSQYTDLPYPPYTLKDEVRERTHYVEHEQCEKGRCHLVSKNNTKNDPLVVSLEPDMLNSFLYEGKQDFDKFRILLAGGGTGFTACHLGGRLRNKNPDIVYLDFSAASMAVAQKRARMRGLEGIRWINEKIENIPRLGLGKFNLIQCSGVLHHLADPLAGLGILSQSMDQEGGAAIMVYAKTGRTGIYQIQQLLRYVNEGVINKETEIQNMWIILNSFNITALERRMKFIPKNTRSYFFRAVQYGRAKDWDIEAYDRLCHKQDRAYTVPELFDFIEGAGLEFVALTAPKTISILTIDDPINFGRLDESLKNSLRNLSKQEQMTVADLVDGTVHKHEFYARKKRSERNFNR